MVEKRLNFDNKGIAIGNTPEDLKNRKKFITNFYANWIIANPTKHIYNVSLGSFIEVRFLSIQETASKAAIRYQSTLAVSYLTEILEKAVKKGRRKNRKGIMINKNVFQEYLYSNMKRKNSGR